MVFSRWHKNPLEIEVQPPKPPYIKNKNSKPYIKNKNSKPLQQAQARPRRPFWRKKIVWPKPMRTAMPAVNFRNITFNYRLGLRQSVFTTFKGWTKRVLLSEVSRRGSPRRPQFKRIPKVGFMHPLLPFLSPTFITNGKKFWRSTSPKYYRPFKIARKRRAYRVALRATATLVNRKALRLRRMSKVSLVHYTARKRRWKFLNFFLSNKRKDQKRIFTSRRLFNTVKQGLSLLKQPVVQKQHFNFLDSIFFYYNLQNAYSLFTYKTVAYLELFLYSMLLSLRIVKYSHQVHHLCFNRLVWVNKSLVGNPFLFLNIYDQISLVNKCAYYYLFQQAQQYRFSSFLMKFFKIYNREFITYRLNKIWLLNNALRNAIPEGMVFELVNPLMYSAPFRRITATFFNANSRDELSVVGVEGLNYNVQQSFLKIRLFEYASFYK